MVKCAFETCEREARTVKHGLCTGHEWQMKHGKPLTPLRVWKRADIGLPGWRKCTRCDEVKRESEFYTKQNKYLYGACKKCHNARPEAAHGD